MSGIIIEDINQKPNKHTMKHEFWSGIGFNVVRQRLPVGDYVLLNDSIQDVFDRKEKRGIPVKMMDLLGTYDICVDTKDSVSELCNDICGKQHDRFRDECILAQNNGIKLVILVENDDGFENLKELHEWINPRLLIRKYGRQVYPNSTRGVTLMKACYTMQKKYGVEFLFCSPEESGRRVLEILEGG